MACKTRLYSCEFVAMICDNSGGDERLRCAVELSAELVLKPLSIPKPQPISELSPLNLSLAGLVGALAGMVILAPLLLHAVGSEIVGIVVGAPLGAAVLILGVCKAANNPRIQQWLVGILSVAAIVEVWTLVTRGNILGGIWRKLGARGSGFKRVFLFVTIAFFLSLANKQTSFDREEHQRLVRRVVDQWLEAAIVVLFSLCTVTLNKSEGEENAETTLYKLATRIQAIHRASAQSLPVVVDELLQEARNLGFEGLNDPVTRLGPESKERRSEVWREELKERYETFGHIEVGDSVLIEDEPVVFQGVVGKKGMVRKARHRS